MNYHNTKIFLTLYCILFINNPFHNFLICIIVLLNIKYVGVIQGKYSKPIYETMHILGTKTFLCIKIPLIWQVST